MQDPLHRLLPLPRAAWRRPRFAKRASVHARLQICDTRIEAPHLRHAQLAQKAPPRLACGPCPCPCRAQAARLRCHARMSAAADSGGQQPLQHLQHICKNLAAAIWAAASSPLARRSGGGSRWGVLLDSAVRTRESSSLYSRICSSLCKHLQHLCQQQQFLFSRSSEGMRPLARRSGVVGRAARTRHAHTREQQPL